MPTAPEPAPAAPDPEAGPGPGGSAPTGCARRVRRWAHRIRRRAPLHGGSGGDAPPPRAPAAAMARPAPARTTSELDAAMDAVSADLGDWYHRYSNRSRARNLMDAYRESEAGMLEVVHQACRRTQAASPKRPMAYCFTVMQGILAYRAQPRRRDLEGKYADLVRR